MNSGRVERKVPADELSAPQLGCYDLPVGVNGEEIVPGPLGGRLPAEDAAVKLDTEVQADS